MNGLSHLFHWFNYYSWWLSYFSKEKDIIFLSILSSQDGMVTQNTGVLWKDDLE